MKQEDIIAFLQKQNPKLCTVATADNAGKPAVAVMMYAVSEDGNILFSTHNTTIKWGNITVNPQVAVSVGSDMRTAFLQMYGIAERADGGANYIDWEKKYLQANPAAVAFRSESTVYFRFIIRWARLSDYSQKPPSITEGSW